LALEECHNMLQIVILRLRESNEFYIQDEYGKRTLTTILKINYVKRRLSAILIY